MDAWGFTYKGNIVWHKIRKDGGPDGRGVGFYFRNVTELILFGVRGKNARTLSPGRSQVNYIATRKREHSRKPDEQYGIIERCSPAPFLSYLLVGRGQAGQAGEIRPMAPTSQLGVLILITPRRQGQDRIARRAGVGLWRTDFEDCAVG